MFDYNYIARLPKPVKFFLVAFLVALSVGYFTGINFVRVTESSTPKGVVENYNGNEDVPEATTMKFKKGKREMLTIIHTHILSISFIFFLLGILVWGTDQSIWLKSFLTIEPFISVLTTFGGIYMLWLGYSFFSYVVIFSGILMTLSYILGVLVVMKDLLK
ncbi:hypothetical protein N9V61_04205 [Flavobacteriaceae bacterium]|jgi:hypothetical protein|uniref:hypothetical protein n=1 Tax=Candidatus Arcticimaribacter forsetii TaxID=2820661 RepID=UPI002076EE05|nr:hypothetical protein [Candidatus Arcticimaribacter forsetii]MCH1538596.1 hypothetical protein [Flavobacteriaceae bacterium]MDB2346004.1 hypothetical protein [Flavobacteriaceae bacterium]MDB4609138.1 hypothetical protein [Flavobacteriaceae bacterium]MDB4643179.1 hypothetical protein [Flavobacteriaceae bacterium]MDB4675090.1 hypothetical protein [Flavobacteriaceae bacterium]